MEPRHLAIPAFALVLLFTYGCTEVDSADLKTHGMYAKFTAVDGGSSVKVEANISTGPFSTDTIKLTNGDALYATFAGETRQMTESHALLGEYVYRTTFYTSGANQPVTIDFQRPNAVSAPNSHVTLPAAFTLTSPTAGTVYSISNNSKINVSWTPTSSSSMRIEFSGTCQTSSGGAMSFTAGYSVAADTGDYSLNIGTLLEKFISGKNPPVSITSCGNMNITVTRSKGGIVDNNFGKGGYFTGKEKRSTYVVLNP